MYGRNDGNKKKNTDRVAGFISGENCILLFFFYIDIYYMLVVSSSNHCRVAMWKFFFLLCFISLCHFCCFFLFMFLLFFFGVCKEHLCFFRDEQSRELFSIRCCLYLILKWLLSMFNF